MLVTVNVTQDHIDRGVCGQPQACAISQAMMDMVKPHILISTGFVAVNLNGVTFGFHNNSDFIKKFDEDKSLVKPFSFNLDIPEDCLRVSEPEARQEQPVPELCFA